MPNWIVSADVFSDFSRECGALDASEVRKRMQAGTIAPEDVFLPGQGLSEADYAEIEALASHNGYSDAFRFWRTFPAAPRAPRSLTHKHQAHNSMISVPQAQADGSYRSELLICTGNELISDHVTGQHVQGMVLVEACRQMFIAVSELCHMDHEDGRRSYWIKQGAIQQVHMTLLIVSVLSIGFVGNRQLEGDRVAPGKHLAD